MINEKMINEICLKNHMTKMSISRVPTWVDKNRMEGIEYDESTQTLTPFWIKAGERIYKEPESTHITTLLELISHADMEELPKKSKEIPKNDIVPSNEGILPDFITHELMVKWDKMKTTERVLLFQKTPSDKIKEVEIGTDKNGKKVFAPYVEGNYMFKEANASFMFDWYLDIKEVTSKESGVGVRGILYAWFNDYNKYLSRPATGYQETNKKVNPELALKGATTDAIKKGLSLFGFNSDVYGGEI